MPWRVQIFNKYYKYFSYKIDDIIEQISENWKLKIEQIEQIKPIHY